jgi:hypothetical protein
MLQASHFRLKRTMCKRVVLNMAAQTEGSDMAKAFHSFNDHMAL